MYCAPPTKIDSILRCLETLCDFASVSRTLHTTAFLLWLLSVSFFHSFARSLSLYHCRKCLIQRLKGCCCCRCCRCCCCCCWYRFFRGGEQNLSLLVCPSHENHIISTLCIYLEVRTIYECTNLTWRICIQYTVKHFSFARAHTYWTIHYSVTIVQPSVIYVRRAKIVNS